MRNFDKPVGVEESVISAKTQAEQAKLTICALKSTLAKTRERIEESKQKIEQTDNLLAELRLTEGRERG
jgi:hypothetical protein